MAMQAGVGLSRIIILIGAGYSGTVLLNSERLSVLLDEFQKIVRSWEPFQKSGNSDSETLSSEVLSLAQQVRQLGYNTQITVLNGSSIQSGISALIIPAGVLGTLGYGYMWWKGMSFSDLMFVSKRNMANAVSNLTKHLESVSDTLAKTKRHLTKRIENMDGKVEDVKEMTKLLKNDVSNVRVDLSKIGDGFSDLKNTVCSLDERICMLEDKQYITLAGVDYLCQVVDGKIVSSHQLFFEDQMGDSSNSRGQLISTETPLLLGLKDIFTITDGTVQGDVSATTKQPRNILRSRITSIKISS